VEAEGEVRRERRLRPAARPPHRSPPPAAIAIAIAAAATTTTTYAAAIAIAIAAAAAATTAAAAGAAAGCLLRCKSGVNGPPLVAVSGVNQV
jgi:hypothetical protein